jgi:hypothetical protein
MVRMGAIKNRSPVTRRRRESSLRSPNNRFVIAWVSPWNFNEVGLRFPASEKKADEAAQNRWQSVSGEQLLRWKSQKRALCANCEGNCGRNSLPFRLRGGAGSLALTFLRLNSRVTGKNTGNL